MNYEQALKTLDETVIRNLELKIVISKALEKQIPKKPLRGYTCKANNDSWRSCPVCHARQHNTHKYCSQCGQALDWGKEDE